ncbi:MAG: hypothetical protein JXX29_20520 [Deltaproteobacteria bacterium]|nr:hypothetical protein [Deltaproteobacteria bacterium]MBN2674077.1 hypothetical protein [Deltaproteobacteria bacterium]
MNLFILAIADGRLDIREQQFLEKYADSVGLSGARQEECRQQLFKDRLSFAPVNDIAAQGEALAFLARMVRVDEEFHEKEQVAYISMGKALGYTEEQLGAALRKYWNQDPAFSTPPPASLSAVQAPIPSSSDATEAQPPETATILVITDDTDNTEKLEASASNCHIQYVSLSEADHVTQQNTYAMILFQAAIDEKASKSRLERLKSLFPSTPVAFTARRDQAAQIGYLLESGADKCFVKPLYVNEINKAVAVLSAK